MNKLSFLTAALALSLAAGCDDDDATANVETDAAVQADASTDTDAVAAPVDEAFSSKSRVLAPDVAPADLAAMVDGQTDFALRLFKQVGTVEAGDVFLSPFSVHQALAMTYAGADGETKDEMAEVLGFSLEDARLHAAQNALDLALASRGEQVIPEDQGGGQPLKLSVANSLWGQADLAFLEPFLDVLAENYGAGMRLVNFEADPESARLAINGWVSDKTEERIPELLKDGDITDMTRLVLVNTIYFLASWASPFEEEATEDGTFYLGDGSTVSVPFMKQQASFAYGETDDALSVALPYAGGALSMLVVIPKSTVGELEANLTPATLNALLESQHEREVLLSLPKFETRTHTSLRDTLKALGMARAFSDVEAQFSRMTVEERLHIGNVIHEAWVKVDEAGTEAAAATAVIMDGNSSAPDDPTELVVDRPFLFFIRDHQTGAILFMGRIANPA